MVCAGCGAPLDPDGDRRGDAMRCPFCGSWTRVPGAPQVAPPRDEIERPRAVRVETTPYGVRIVRRWWSPVYVFLLFFCAVWNGVLLMFYGVAGAAGAPLLFFLFPLIHVGVGLALTYVTLAGFFNRTTVTAQRDGVLMVRHGPLPWPGKRDFAARDVAQLFVVEKRTHTRDGEPQPSYVLTAQMRNRRRVPVMKVLGAPLEHVLYFEQELERSLGIRDVPVAGEVARTV